MKQQRGKENAEVFAYDREGLESRKEHKAKGSAIDMATAMSIEL
jgi:hypothetical protein